MNKNDCIKKGCPFYMKSGKPRLDRKTMLMDCSIKYMCNRYCKEIKDVCNCTWEKK